MATSLGEGKLWNQTSCIQFKKWAFCHILVVLGKYVNQILSEKREYGF